MVYYSPGMARSDPQFNLRIPSELKERIEASAKASGRSATAEIIARLEGSFGENVDASQVQLMRRWINQLGTELEQLRKGKK